MWICCFFVGLTADNQALFIVSSMSSPMNHCKCTGEVCVVCVWRGGGGGGALCACIYHQKQVATIGCWYSRKQDYYA